MPFKLLTHTKNWLKAQPGEMALILALGLLGLATGWWARIIILDDALITYRVAENLAYGRGFVYNVGERVQVTTTPLYALVLAVGTWVFGDAPTAALVLNISLAALIPILAYVLGRRLSGRITGLAGAVLLAFSPLLVMAFSMESYLYVTLILASMVAYTAARQRLAGMFVGATALVRGDGVLLGAVLLTYDLLAHRRLRWRLILPAVTIPAAWYLFAVFYYGSPFPATLGAKVAQGELNWLGVRFLDGLLAYWDTWIRVQSHDVFYLAPLLMIIGLVPVVRAERPWLIMIGRDVLYVIGFTALAVPTTAWYYAPLMPGVALLTARGIQFTAQGLTNLGLKSVISVMSGWPPSNSPHRGNRPTSPPLGGIEGGLSAKRGGATTGHIFLQYVLAAGLVTLLLTGLYPVTAAIVQQSPDWKAQVYPDTARWIAANTNDAANLATIDIGHLGYWSKKHVIDIVGLAQPDVGPQIARGDFGYAIRHYRPDMVLIGHSWLPEVQRTEWFQTNYAPRRYFKFKTLDEPLLLFSRPQGVKVQPDSIPATAIQPLEVDFNRQIILTGYHLKQPLSPGSPMNLTLFWQAAAPIAVDFTVFVQLLDPNNRIVAQKDNKPQDGFYGTLYWQPGEVVIDLHSVLIPPDIPPGQYNLLLGFYETETGLRLQILDETGAFKSDHVRLTGIKVQSP
ncbi:MAG: glycosyltransferase family 39 protein [Anaerolineae bacterium]|nr:glycosyltransferase family 39 protein [Anaerolineae bacterium]